MTKDRRDETPPSGAEEVNAASPAAAPARPRIWEELFGWFWRGGRAAPVAAEAAPTAPSGGVPGPVVGEGGATVPLTGSGAEPLAGPGGLHGPASLPTGAEAEGDAAALASPGVMPLPLAEPSLPASEFARVERPQPPHTSQPPLPPSLDQGQAVNTPGRPPAQGLTTEQLPPEQPPPLRPPPLHPVLQPQGQTPTAQQPPPDHPPLPQPQVQPPVLQPQGQTPTAQQPPLDQPPLPQPQVQPPVLQPPGQAPTAQQPSPDHPPLPQPQVQPPVLQPHGQTPTAQQPPPDHPPLPQPQVQPPVLLPPGQTPAAQQPPPDHPPLPQPQVQPPVLQPNPQAPNAQQALDQPPLPQPQLPLVVQHPNPQAPSAQQVLDQPPLPQPQLPPVVQHANPQAPSAQQVLDQPPLPQPQLPPVVQQPNPQAPNAQQPLDQPPQPQPQLPPVMQQPNPQAPNAQQALDQPPLPQPQLPPVVQHPNPQAPSAQQVLDHPPLPQPQLPPLVQQPNPQAPNAQHPLDQPPLPQPQLPPVMQQPNPQAPTAQHTLDQPPLPQPQLPPVVQQPDPQAPTAQHVPDEPPLPQPSLPSPTLVTLVEPPHQQPGGANPPPLVAPSQGSVVQVVSVTPQIPPANREPDFVAQPGNVTEDHNVTPPGLLVANGQVRVFDPDPGQNHVQPAELHGEYGTLVLRADGSWTYSAANRQPAIQELNTGDTLQEVFTIHSADGTPQRLIVNIHGSDEQNAIIESTPLTVQEDVNVSPRGLLLASGLIEVTDPNAGEAHVPPGSFAGSYGTFEIASDGSWRYVAENRQPAIQSLGAGDTLTDTVRVHSLDGTPHDLRVTIEGTNDAARLTSTQEHVTEDRQVSPAGQLTASGSLFVTDADRGQDHAVPMTVAGHYGTFVVNADGSWRYAATNAQPAIQQLGAGDRLVDSARVHSADGTTHQLQVTIHGSNDPASFHAAPGHVTEDRDVSPWGRLTTSGVVIVTDTDHDQNHLIAQTQGGRYGQFEVNADGTWHYSADNDRWEIQDLRSGESLTDQIRVQAVDGSSYQIQVVIHGTDESWEWRPVSSTVSGNNGNHHGWGNAWPAPPPAGEAHEVPATYADLIPHAPAASEVEPPAYVAALAEDAAGAGQPDHDPAAHLAADLAPGLHDDAPLAHGAVDDAGAVGDITPPQETVAQLEPPLTHHIEG